MTLKKHYGLIKYVKNIYLTYYQFVFLGIDGEIIEIEGLNYYKNFGIGGNDCNLLIVSGTMENEDLIVKQPSGNYGLYAISLKYNLGWYGVDKNDPLPITYVALKSIVSSTIKRSDFLINNETTLQGMCSQPFEQVTYKYAPVTYLNEPVTFLKPHLIP